MPKGVYKHKSSWNKGKHLSIEHKRKMGFKNFLNNIDKRNENERN
jgi:hypothetical protein